MASHDQSNPRNYTEKDERNLSSVEISTFGIESSERNTFAVVSDEKVHSVPLRYRQKMMHDCAKGVEFLHSKGFMHCDIKSLNFLVTKVGACYFLSGKIVTDG